MTNLVAAVIVDDASPRFIPCLHALRRALPSSRIVVASAVDDIALAGVAATIGAELALEHDAAALVRTFRDRVDGTVRAGDAAERTRALAVRGISDLLATIWVCQQLIDGAGPPNWISRGQ